MARDPERQIEMLFDDHDRDLLGQLLQAVMISSITPIQTPSVGSSSNNRRGFDNSAVRRRASSARRRTTSPLPGSAAHRAWE